MGLQHYTQDMSRIPLKYHTNVLFYTKYTHPTLICRGIDARMHRQTDARTDGQKIFTQYSVLYKQIDMGFAAEAGFFWGGKGAVLPPKKV